MPMTYTILTGAKSVAGSIASWVNNSSFPASTVLEEAEAWIYGRLRVREMLTALDGTMVTGAAGATIPLPDDFEAMSWLGYRGQWTGRIAPLPPDELQDLRQFDASNGYVLAPGQPFRYSLRGTVVEFPRAPDQPYTYRQVHYARPAPLSSSNETNWLTRRAPRLVRQACCAFASEFMKAEGEKLYWLNLAQAAIDELNATSDGEMGGLIADMQAV